MNIEVLERDLEYRRENLGKWNNIIKTIFPKEIPKTFVWTSLNEIIDTLNVVGDNDLIGYIFYPTFGGSHFAGAIRASETGFIGLLTPHLSAVLKPEKLVFEFFLEQTDDTMWAYFRIEASIVPSIFEGFDDDNGIRESLTLLESGEYAEAGLSEYFDEDQNPELIGSQRITRYTKSSFVIFAQKSPYNSIDGTVDARHNKMTASEFRNYVSTLIKVFSETVDENRSI